MKTQLQRFFLVWFASVLWLSPVWGQTTAPKPELLAVVASGNTVAANVGAQVGCSPFLLLFNRQGVLVEALDNPYKDGGSAGVLTTELLASKGVKLLVSESFGPKILATMEKRGMRALEFKGKVADAIKKAQS